MTHFNRDNTEGFSDAELIDLNETLDILECDYDLDDLDQKSVDDAIFQIWESGTNEPEIMAKRVAARLGL